VALSRRRWRTSTSVDGKRRAGKPPRVVLVEGRGRGAGREPSEAEWIRDGETSASDLYDLLDA
jgi:hypothetical protein